MQASVFIAAQMANAETSCQLTVKARSPFILQKCLITVLGSGVLKAVRLRPNGLLLSLDL